jgi:hypothetical protein
LVHHGIQRLLELFEEVLAAEEVRVADEEAVTVIVRIDEPTGDVIRL